MPLLSIRSSISSNCYRINVEDSILSVQVRNTYGILIGLTSSSKPSERGLDKGLGSIRLQEQTLLQNG